METESAAAPTSQDIAASVIESAEHAAPESGSESSDTSAPERVSLQNAQEDAAPVAAPTPVKLTAAQEFIVSKGHKWGKREGSNADLTYLPATTVATMLDDYKKQHETTWQGERSVIEQQAKQYQADLTEYINAIRGEPTQFLQTLAQHDPRYAAFLQKQAPQQQAPTEFELKPDTPMADGSMGYSIGAIQKWLDAKLEAKFQPIQEREKAEKERAQQEQAQHQSREYFRQAMTEASTWSGFGTIAADGSLTPFQQEVLAVLEADSAQAKAQNRRPTATLRQAYLEVQAKQLAADDTAKRAKFMEEMNKAPKSTSVTRSGAEHVGTVGKSRTSADIVRQVIAESERG